MTQPFEFYYWPMIQGRGEFVRLVFEAAKADYTDIARTQGMAVLAPECAAQEGEGPNIPFAPPILKHGDVTLSQTANVCAYIAEQTGLAPDNENDRRTALGMFLTIMDFANETHDTHHPISVLLYYEDQKPEAARRAADFRTNRLPMYLSYFEMLLAQNPDQSGWLLGNRMTYCDLALFQMVTGLNFAFPKAMKRLGGPIPLTLALAERIAAHPAIAAYLASERRIPFNQDGLFRHYPELDDPA